MIPILRQRRKVISSPAADSSFSMEGFYNLNMSNGHWFLQGEAMSRPGIGINLSLEKYNSIGSALWKSTVPVRTNWIVEYSVNFNYVANLPSAGVAFFLAEDWIGPIPRNLNQTNLLLDPSCYSGKLFGLIYDATNTWTLIYNDGTGPQILKRRFYNPPYELFWVRINYDYSVRKLAVQANENLVFRADFDVDVLPEVMELGWHGSGYSPARDASAYPAFQLPRAAWLVVPSMFPDILTRRLFDNFFRSPKGIRTDVNPVSTWTPASIEMRAWFDPSREESLETEGVFVKTLRDLSGNNRHATQSVISASPQVSLSPFRFRKALYFNGSSFLSLAPDTVDGTGQTSVFIVFRSLLKEGQPITFQDAGYPGSPPVRGSLPESEGMLDGPYPVSARSWGGPFAADYNSNEFRYVYNPKRWNIFFTRTIALVRNEAGSTETWDDGSPVSASIPPHAYQGTDGGRLGMNLTLSKFYAGWIGEVIFTDVLVTTALRQKIEGYLAWKWGSRDRLPFNHPYRLTPPRSTSAA